MFQLPGAQATAQSEGESEEEANEDVQEPGPSAMGTSSGCVDTDPDHAEESGSVRSSRSLVSRGKNPRRTKKAKRDVADVLAELAEDNKGMVQMVRKCSQCKVHVTCNI